jgi:phenylalanyl-tRNA synthetase alpha chain
MKKELEKLLQQAKKDIESATTPKDLEAVEVKYFGRKEGQLNLILKGLKDLSAEEKKEMGAKANDVKSHLQLLIEDKGQHLRGAAIDAKLESEWLDVTLPGKKPVFGHTHPMSVVQYELEDIFKSLGFMVLDGPQLESDYYNFQALNTPEHHPSRDSQDTFYVKNKAGNDKLVLRTHTSGMQVRAMQKYGAPIKVIVPGRVFRYEASDASHDNTFYQMEGLMVDKNISIANLIAIMKVLLKGILKRDVKVRLRPGFFPFVEPGFELDINCLICGGQGCSVCKHRGWLELWPCGMVHPEVLKAGGIDASEYSGFAFGLGLTRLVMMRYGIEDIRLLTSGDWRFLKQF